MNTTVVLFPGGTHQKTVDLSTWDFPALGFYAVMTTNPDVQKWITDLEVTMNAVIAAVRAFQPLPEECFVPDLWHYRGEFAPEDGLKMFEETTSTAIWIAQHCYEQRERTVRNGIQGNLFTNSKH